jgi:hypothetical protein
VLRDPLVRELLEARHVCVLATLEPDGSVHAVPTWLAADGARSCSPPEVHDRYVTATGQELPDARTFLASDDVALRFRPEAATLWDENP